MLGRLLQIGIAILLASALDATSASSQDYPNRPIRIIAPLPAATAPDMVARLIGQKLSERLGQPVVIENRAGANGNIGGELVARSPADGYTLLLPQDSLIVLNPHVYSKMSFSPLNDLVPVASIASNQFYLAINPSLPVKTLPEFVEHARRANPPLFYGSAGHGSQHHMAMEMLKKRAGINLVHVPFRGATPAATGTLTGEVAAVFAGGAIAPMVQSGQLRVLGVAGKQRTAEFPDVPTIAEFYPDFEITIWFALFAPAGTPEPVLAKLRSELSKIIAERDVAEKLRASGGMTPYPSTPEEFAAVIQRDFRTFGESARAMGLRID